jgi:2-haloacid dehalogenase
MPGQNAPEVRALLFDVFGTCVDWRSGVIREGAALARKCNLGNIDWAKFADAWRALYHPQMERVRNGSRPWTKLDNLHRESLDKICRDFGISGVAESDLAEFNRVWHRLDPWPDVVEGFRRLKSKYIIAPNSNGHIALMVTMAKRAGLPWDAILGAEIARAYKPSPEEYLRNVKALDLEPSQVMMVAAHNYDVIGAAACGLKTAFVPRLLEFGPAQTTDRSAESNYDLVAADFADLAAKLGC